MLKQLPMPPHRRGIGVASDEHHRLAKGGQHGGDKIINMIGLDMHHRTARKGAGERYQQRQRHLRATRMLDIAVIVDHQVRALADRLGMHVVERQVCRAVASDATQLVHTSEACRPAGARYEPAPLGRDADPAFRRIEDIHQGHARPIA